MAGWNTKCLQWCETAIAGYRVLFQKQIPIHPLVNRPVVFNKKL